MLFDGLGVPLRYLSLSLFSFFLSKQTHSIIPKTLFTYSSVTFTLFSVATYLQLDPKLLGKTTSGEIPLWSSVIFFPFHTINRFFTYAVLLKSNRADKITFNVYLGGFHGYKELDHWEAILDLTAELPKKGSCNHYLNLPSFDGMVFEESIDLGAKFFAKHVKTGPVLVHCAHGVGRSTTLLRAGLVEAGISKNIDEAYKLIKKYRPRAKSSRVNQKKLEIWESRRKDN
eukprot:snap_masked-scaffold_84-processed-gene-0.13-mRNA-1 protein AED:1.00 eAED:1.00 QI:0/-1/0/0/-1/1/1/0/228